MNTFYLLAERRKESDLNPRGWRSSGWNAIPPITRLFDRFVSESDQSEAQW